jgi:DNA ligase (NAD+)
MLDLSKSKEELIELYLMHKAAYYGTTNSDGLDDDIESISDSEFDELEQYLIDTYQFEPPVGADEDYGRHVKGVHAVPMLSLSKYHAPVAFSITDASKLISIPKTRLQRLSWKLDGFGISYRYINGHLISAITRGNKTTGADITAKFGQLVPQQIPILDDIEIRVEALMNKSTFDTKYAPLGFAHPRNAVVGIKNNLDIHDNRINDVKPIVVDAILANGTTFDIAKLHKYFTVVDYVDILGTPDELQSAYMEFFSNRSAFQFPTDGLVLSPIAETERLHNGHHPLNMVAIKFPAPTFRTKVTDITSRQQRTGSITPRVHFEPVIIDGRKLTKCSGYNYAWLVERGVSIGTEIEIKVSGDIIPVIAAIIVKSDIPIDLPGDAWLGVDRIDTKVQLSWHKFCHALHQLNFDGFGGSMFKIIYDAIAQRIENPTFDKIFDSTFVNESTIADLGPTRSKQFIDQINNIKSIKLSKLIIMLAHNGCGAKTAKQLANYHSRIDHDFTGLEKDVITFFTSGPGSIQLLDLIASLANFGISVEYEQKQIITADAIYYVLTGSPKSAGFKTKAVFKQTLPENWIETDDMKKATYLITDDLSSTSSKMQLANKLGKSIKTYETILS